MGDPVTDLVALFSEHAIEAELIRMVAQGNPDDATMIAAHKAALREIDRQEVAGTYPTGTPDTSGMEDARERDRPFLNYCAGLKSSDPEQRQRFRDVAARIGNWSYQEAAPFLAVLEPAKGHAGSPAGAYPWGKWCNEMDAMRLLVVRDGMTPAAAARVIVGNQKVPENRAADLAKLYRKKMALRE